MMKKNLLATGTALLAVLGLASSCVSTSVQKEVESETAPQDYSAIHDSQLPGPSEPVNFTRHVKPILEMKCLPCHSRATAETAFKLDRKELAFSPTPAGARIVPGHPEKSLLLNVAGTHRNVAVMPPVGNRLTEAESRLLIRWIREGAPWPDGPRGRLQAP